MTSSEPQPLDPLGFCAPCLPRGAWTRAVALVDGTGMCRAHAVAALSAVTSGPLASLLRR